ncbi:unnamed protein product [Ectocarpus sp. 8 AP-2014]
MLRSSLMMACFGDVFSPGLSLRCRGGTLTPKMPQRHLKLILTLFRGPVRKREGMGISENDGYLRESCISKDVQDVSRDCSSMRYLRATHLQHVGSEMVDIRSNVWARNIRWWSRGPAIVK